MITVAVLRGGVGDEHDISLQTGLTALRHLEAMTPRSGRHYKPIDVYIDRTGVWHVRGLPMLPPRALGSVDVVFNALHGYYGEDGQVQRELDRLGVPYTGSRALASSIAMNKPITKHMLKSHGIQMARHAIVSVTPNLEAEILELFRSFPQPSIVKPTNSGSSVGVVLAQGYNQFRDAIKNAFTYSREVLVEEYIRGREATAAVIDRMRGVDRYSLPPVEIEIAGHGIFDYDLKYSPTTIERCPGLFARAETEELERLAALVHKELDLRHYSRSDFIVTPKRGIYFLEVNTLPALTDTSLLPKSLDAVGISMDEFLDHVLTMALEKQ